MEHLHRDHGPEGDHGGQHERSEQNRLDGTVEAANPEARLSTRLPRLPTDFHVYRSIFKPFRNGADGTTAI